MVTQPDNIVCGHCGGLFAVASCPSQAVANH